MRPDSPAVPSVFLLGQKKASDSLSPVCFFYHRLIVGRHVVCRAAGSSSVATPTEVVSAGTSPCGAAVLVARTATSVEPLVFLLLFWFPHELRGCDAHDVPLQHSEHVVVEDANVELIFSPAFSPLPKALRQPTSSRTRMHTADNKLVLLGIRTPRTVCQASSSSQAAMMAKSSTVKSSSRRPRLSLTGSVLTGRFESPSSLLSPSFQKVLSLSLSS